MARLTPLGILPNSAQDTPPFQASVFSTINQGVELENPFSHTDCSGIWLRNLDSSITGLTEATLGDVGGVFITSVNGGWNSGDRGFSREFSRPGERAN